MYHGQVLYVFAFFGGRYYDKIFMSEMSWGFFVDEA